MPYQEKSSQHQRKEQAHQSNDKVHTTIRILQMDCPTEEAMIRGLFKDNPAVIELNFNLIQRILTVTHRPEALESILNGIQGLGFTPEIQQDDSSVSQAPLERHPWWPIIIAALIACASEISHYNNLSIGLTAGLALIAIAIGGTHTYKKGWIASD